MNAEQLLKKYFPSPAALAIVLEHSRLVAARALLTADAVGDASLDRTFLREAALLHDIGICRTASPDIACHGTEPYIRHGIIGREILEKEGLPRHALVCERHIGVGLTVADIREQKLPLPERDMSPVTREERIICYADLFYSKRPDGLHLEKTIESVQANLSRFSTDKVAVFDSWMHEFNCRR